jgi:hypothetical protein
LRLELPSLSAGQGNTEENDAHAEEKNDNREDTGDDTATCGEKTKGLNA